MFGISFLNPAFFIGLLAISVPIFIHFLIKRNIKIIPFSFINFLEQASQKKLRRFKLSKILLLLLRILIIAVLCAALAKPFMRTYGNLVFSEVEGTSIVILIDNSYSMSMIDTNISRFEKAKDTAMEIVNLMSERDEIALISFAETATPVTDFSKNKSLLLGRLKELKISSFTTNVSSGLKTANKLIKKSHNSIKKIIIITDMQKNGWAEINSDSFLHDVKINLINVGEKNASNTAITKVDFSENAIIGQLVSLKASVKNYGKDKFENKIISLIINNKKVYNQKINLEPNEEKKILLYYTFPSTGIYSGSIEITDDFMSCDNKFYFSIKVIERIKILSVYENKNNSSKEKENLYINIALNPSGSSESFVNITEKNKYELDKIEFSNYDIFIFSNVSSLTPLQIKVLEECVKGGKGILFFLGDKINIDSYNNEMFRNGTGVFPAKISYRVNSPKNNFFNISKVDYTHSIFSILNDSKIFSKIAFYSFYRLETEELFKKTKILASYNDGLPALVEKKFEQGKVLLFSSSIGLEWSNLPLNNIFPSLINQTIRYLSVNNAAEKMNFILGDESLPNNIRNLPGIYNIERNNSNFIYSINIKTNDSNLETISEDEIINRTKINNIHIAFNVSKVKSNLFGWFHGDIWKILLLLLLFLLIAETILSNKKIEP